MDVKPHKIPHPFRKLNKELIDKIVQDIKEGSTHNLAAHSNNISVAALNIWRQQGEVDLAYGNEDSLCAYLVASLSKVKQEEVKWCRESIKFSPKGHTGAQWTLEHAYWREYGRNEQIKVMADQLDQDDADNLERDNG